MANKHALEQLVHEVEEPADTSGTLCVAEALQETVVEHKASQPSPDRARRDDSVHVASD